VSVTRNIERLKEKKNIFYLYAPGGMSWQLAKGRLRQIRRVRKAQSNFEGRYGGSEER
jgi:hypothetical protein